MADWLDCCSPQAPWIISAQRAFDSDILNFLPANNPAVKGLRSYNSEFTQTRELAFLLDLGKTSCRWRRIP